MDRRQKKTRTAIFDAFSRLLARVSYSQITVQQIADEANVGRTTFYAHFPTKDDLLRELCTELFEHVFSDEPEAESTHDFSSAEAEPLAVVTHILYHLREHGRTLLVLLTSDNGGLFQEYFHRYFDELVMEHILEGREEAPTAEPSAPELSHELLVEHISASFVNIVRWWLRSEMTQSPEAIAGYFMSLIGPLA